MKRFFFSIVFLLYFAFPKSLAAQEAYTVNSFKSDITIEENTQVTVKENIEVNFSEERHGIIRFIPTKYTIDGVGLDIDLQVLSVTNGAGKDILYEASREGRNVSIKIGDADRYVSGRQTYEITYKISDTIRRYEGYDEFYWDVLGANWDTTIARAEAVVHSPYAPIKEVTCYAGPVGTEQKDCTASISDENKADFSAHGQTVTGEDMTIVVAFLPENELMFPSQTQKFLASLRDNWPYGLVFLPLFIMVYLWYRRGRDRKYGGDNVYYEPDKKEVTSVSLFARPHLPMVYHPIDGLTPAQVGTILDERVDIHDVVAEILELARLGYIKLERIEKRRAVLKDKIDYAFTKLKKDSKGLLPYQQFLLEKLFSKPSSGDNYVLLSDLKKSFYKHLEEFRKKLYADMGEKGYFDGNPNTTRLKWVGYSILILSVCYAPILLTDFIEMYPIRIVLMIMVGIPTLIIPVFMPRRSARGYQLYRQIEGLKFYLSKGKWREEVNEKHLFISEMLPLAVSLSVVDKLAKDMEELSIKPPEYMNGFTTASFVSSINSFQKSSASTLASTPGSSGSGWSGGSGFSGGSSGGGFGGGGGSSW